MPVRGGAPSAPSGAPPNDFLTITEAAAYVRVGRKVIDEAIRRKRLRVLQLTSSRRAIRIYRPDLLKLLGAVQ